MAAGKALSTKDMNGNKIVNVGAPTVAGDVARKTESDAAYEGARSRANHSGSQLASTVSDFDTAVRTSRLDQMAVPTADLNVNSRKITNQGDPTAAQDSATKAYVDAQLAGLLSGQQPKGTVRAYVAVNVNIASPGATIDGLAAAPGDIFILSAQTTGTQNGPYVFNGAATPMTRAINWDTNTEAVLGSYWIVREGTKADSFALLNNDTAINLGTTVPGFTVISVAGGAAIGRHNSNCPATAAGAVWTVPHNLNSTDVICVIKRVASPFDVVDVYQETTDANNISIKPDIALAVDEFRAVVKY